jgi:hypothetical protein
MRTGGFIIFLIGAVSAILVGWALHNYPQAVVSEATYCRLCGTRLLETKTATYLGAEQTTTSPGSALHRLMVDFNGDHPHEWAVPRAFVAPTHPVPDRTTSQQIAQEVMKRKLTDLQHLEKWAKGLGILESAMQNNRFRTVSLVQRILDERSYLDFHVILILDRVAPWPERWAILETFLRSYHCQHSEEMFQCMLVINGKDKVMFTRDPTNVQTTSIDWHNWTPNDDVATTPESAENPTDAPPPASDDSAEPVEEPREDSVQPKEPTEDRPEKPDDEPSVPEPSSAP